MGQLKCAATGKVMLTRKAAAGSASWWRRAQFARMKHYRCKACGAYHIGNDRRPRRRRR